MAASDWMIVLMDDEVVTLPVRIALIEIDVV